MLQDQPRHGRVSGDPLLALALPPIGAAPRGSVAAPPNRFHLLLLFDSSAARELRRCLVPLYDAVAIIVTCDPSPIWW